MAVDQIDIDTLAAAKAQRLAMLQSGKESMELPDGQGGYRTLSLADVNATIATLEQRIAGSAGPVFLGPRMERYR